MENSINSWTPAQKAENDAITNRQALELWQEDFGLDEPLALGVAEKVLNDLPLSPLEKGVLHRGLTTKDIEFVKRNIAQL